MWIKIRFFLFNPFLSDYQLSLHNATGHLFLQDGQPKQYVQDLVFGHGSLLYRLWGQEEGSLYVCGKVAMASGVQVYKSL